MFYRTGVIADWSFTLLEHELSTFLLLWPWPWPSDLHILDPYSLKIFWTCGDELPTSNFPRQGFRELSSDRQTARQTDRRTDRHDRSYIPRRFADGELSSISWTPRRAFFYSVYYRYAVVNIDAVEIGIQWTHTLHMPNIRCSISLSSVMGWSSAVRNTEGGPMTLLTRTREERAASSGSRRRRKRAVIADYHRRGGTTS